VGLFTKDIKTMDYLFLHVLQDNVGSLLLGLYGSAGRLDSVGFTSPISNAARPELTRRWKNFGKLRALRVI